MQEPRIWRQQNWIETELRALGFQRYETQRQLRVASENQFLERQYWVTMRTMGRAE